MDVLMSQEHVLGVAVKKEQTKQGQTSRHVRNGPCTRAPPLLPVLWLACNPTITTNTTTHTHTQTHTHTHTHTQPRGLAGGVTTMMTTTCSPPP
jgi:hypothetical protein